MDWTNVTVEDLIDALREVDWSSPPRPPSEFFSRFTVPRSFSKWNSRLKCNLYYYQTNYFILIVSVLMLGFLRRPLAILAALLTALSIALLNDRYTKNGMETKRDRAWRRRVVKRENGGRGRETGRAGALLMAGCSGEAEKISSVRVRSECRVEEEDREDFD